MSIKEAVTADVIEFMRGACEDVATALTENVNSMDFGNECLENTGWQHRFQRPIVDPVYALAVIGELALDKAMPPDLGPFNTWGLFLCSGATEIYETHALEVVRAIYHEMQHDVDLQQWVDEWLSSHTVSADGVVVDA